jgi:hypothetical protein
MLTVTMPGKNAQQFRVEQVDFANQADCEAYATLKNADLLTLPRMSGHAVNFPAGTAVTHECKQQ